MTDHPAWPEVRGWVAEATNSVEVLPVDGSARDSALLKLQVTTRSPMGAIVHETGGLLVDGGWLRILGSGHPRLPRTLPGWNEGRTWHKADAPPPCLMVADDILGGLFAINGGGLAGKPGNVHYFAPDTLGWEDLEMGYSDFVWWALKGNLAEFYESFRWPDWEREVASLGGDQAFSFFPFLWADGPHIAERTRGVVSMNEVFHLHLETLEQLAPES